MGRMVDQTVLNERLQQHTQRSGMMIGVSMAVVVVVLVGSFTWIFFRLDPFFSDFTGRTGIARSTVEPARVVASPRGGTPESALSTTPLPVAPTPTALSATSPAGRDRRNSTYSSKMSTSTHAPLPPSKRGRSQRPSPMRRPRKATQAAVTWPRLLTKETKVRTPTARSVAPAISRLRAGVRMAGISCWAAGPWALLRRGAARAAGRRVMGALYRSGVRGPM